METTIDFSDPEAAAELVPKLKDFVLIHGQMKAAEAHVEELKKLKEELQEECLTLMDNAGVSSMSVDGVTIFPKTNTYASCNKENEAGAFAFLEEAGYGALIKLTVNSRSLSSAVTEMREQDIEIPDGVFNINDKRTLGLRKK